MTYEETLEYLYNRLPMFTRTGPAALKMDLDNTLSLCAALGEPQKKFRSIHIAGTNGKGSTSHMLASILQAAGYKTGLYTSPHIFDFGERIRINGSMADRQFIMDFVEKAKPLIEKIEPSFFELSVAMAFEWFARNEVDVAVIETGLGGRLDSTNVLTPVLSVITNVGFDHEDLLGSSLDLIASEKAGIIKPHVPVVVGEQLPETRQVFIDKANGSEAPLQFAEERYIIEFIDPLHDLLICHIKDLETGVVEKFNLDLPGLYQSYNARTVLASVNELRKAGFRIDPDDLKKGIESVRDTTGLRGRWEIAGSHPTMIFDAAHNADGLIRVVEQLNAVYSNRTWHFILGFVKDKDVSRMLGIIPKGHHYYYTNAHIPRALPHHELSHIAKLAGLGGNSFDDINEAITEAKNKASTEDVIIVCGSFYILGEARYFTV